MKSYSEIKDQPHDISGIEKPDSYMYEKKNGVYYPVTEISGVIDCTPTWQSLVPALLDIHASLSAKTRLKPEQEESIKNIKSEFVRMAAAADKWNAHCKQLKTQK